MRRKLVLFALTLALAVTALGHRAEAALCTEGSTRLIHTGSCCSFNRSLYETWECQGGLWGPTGQYTCFGICQES